MADWMDLIGGAVAAAGDAGADAATGPVSSAADSGFDWSTAFSGLEPGTGSAVDFANMAGPESQSLLSGLEDWAKANPKLAGALFGASGPLAGLLGSLGSRGVTGTQSGSQSGFNNSTNAQQQQTAQSGFNNQTQQTTIDPAAQGAMDRLTADLTQSAGGAQGAYDQGLSMLRQLATQGMAPGGPSGASANTTPQAAPVTGFPAELPTTYNAGLGNLIKQAFGSFVGDLGGQAITNARGRGFAGGADLLNTAAAPMMGQSLAQVPAMEAKAYLDHVLQAYGLQSENASRRAGAEAGALNAATNALGPGVAKYGIDRQQDNNQLGQMSSLLQALMGPQANLRNANLGLLSAAPRGSQQNTLSGSQTNQTLSGTNTSQSGGNTSGQTAVPIGQAVGKGLGDIIGGIGVGMTAGGGPDFTGAGAKADQAKSRASLLKLLGS